jgi:hypothetical protein
MPSGRTFGGSGGVGGSGMSSPQAALGQARSVLSSAVRGVLSTVQQAASSPLPGNATSHGFWSSSNGALPTQPGVHKAVARCAALLPSRWVSVYLYIGRKKGLLTGSTNECVVVVDGMEVIRTGDLPFPKNMASVPLTEATIGEDLEGEIGPVYFFGDGSGVLSSKAQLALTDAHTGDTVSLLPRALSRQGRVADLSDVPVGATGTTSPGPQQTKGGDDHTGVVVPPPYALYHPAYCARNDIGAGCALLPAPESRRASPDARHPADDGAASLTYDLMTCESGDVFGDTASALVGHNGTVSIAGTSIRDTINVLGGLPVLLPFFGSSSSMLTSLVDVMTSVSPSTTESALSAIASQDGGAQRPSDVTKEARQLDFSADDSAAVIGIGSGDRIHHTISDTAAEEHAPLSFQPPEERRSIVSQLLDIFTLFLKDHVPNCQQALRVSLFSLIRLEIAPYLRLKHGPGETLQRRASHKGSEPSDAKQASASVALATPQKHGPADGVHAEGASKPPVDPESSRRRQGNGNGPHAAGSLQSGGSRCAAHSDPHLVRALMNLTHVASAIHELRVDAWGTLVCWFPLFSLSSYEVQMDLFFQLRQAARARPEFFRNNLTVAYLVDALHHWYGIVSSDTRDVHAITVDDLITAPPPREVRSAESGDAEAAPASSRRDVMASFLSSGEAAVRRRRSSSIDTLDSHGRPLDLDVFHPFFPFEMRASMLREAIKVIGCVLSLARVVLQPSELSLPAGPSHAHIVPHASSTTEATRASGNAGSTGTAASLIPVSPVVPPPLPMGPRGGSGAVESGMERRNSLLRLPQNGQDDILHMKRSHLEPFLFLLLSEEPKLVGKVPEYSPIYAEQAGEEPLHASRKKQKRNRYNSEYFLPSPHDLLAAEILSFLGGILDYEASHSHGEVSQLLVGAAQAALGSSASYNSSAVPTGNDGAQFDDSKHRLRASFAKYGMLLGAGCPAALAALDAASAPGDFVSFLLFGILPRARHSTLVKAAAMRALFHALRVNGGRPGRWLDPQTGAARSNRNYGSVKDKDRMIQLVSSIHLSRNLLESTASPNPAASRWLGSFWAQDFQRAHGFDFLFYLLRDGAPLDNRVYTAIVESLALVDSVDFITTCDVETENTHGSVSESSFGSPMGVQRRDLQAWAEASEAAPESGTWFIENRAFGLYLAELRLEHLIALDQSWYVPCTVAIPEAQSHRRLQRSNSLSSLSSSILSTTPVVASADLVHLLLRLAPFMSASMQRRAITEIAAMFARSEATKYTVVRCWNGWEVQLFRLLASLGPVPGSTSDSSSSKHSWYPDRENVLNEAPWFFDEHVNYAAREVPKSTVHAHLPAKDIEDMRETYRVGEGILLLLCRDSMNLVDGWKPFQRLLALQPLVHSAKADGPVSNAPSVHLGAKLGTVVLPALGHWSAAPAAYNATAYHCRRLICLAFLNTLFDFDIKRTRQITRAHIDNLIGLTALVEHQVAFTRPQTSAGPESGSMKTASGNSTSSSEPREGAGHLNRQLRTIDSTSSLFDATSGEYDEINAPSRMPAPSVSTPVPAGRQKAAIMSQDAPSSGRRGRSASDVSLDDIEDGMDESTPSWDRDGMLSHMGISRPKQVVIPSHLPPEIQEQLRKNLQKSGLVELKSLATTPRQVQEGEDASNDDTSSMLVSTPASASVSMPENSVESPGTIAAPEAQLKPDEDITPKTRFDGLLAWNTLVLWDRLLLPSPEAADRFLAMTSTAFPLSGNLKTLLVFLSTWVLKNYPLYEDECTRSLARLHRLLGSTIRALPAPIKSAAALDQSSEVDARTLDTPAAGSDGSRSSQARQAGHKSAASATPTTMISEWEEMKIPGRGGLSPMHIVASILQALHAHLLRVVQDVEEHRLQPPDGNTAAAADSKAGNATHIINDDDRRDYVDLCMPMLLDILTLAPSLVSAFHTDTRRFQVFLDGYQDAKALRHSSANDGEPFSTDALHDAASIFGTASQGNWRWLVPLPIVSVGTSAGTVQTWLEDPSWSSDTSTALNACSDATEEAAKVVDATMAKTWKGVANLIRLDCSAFKPFMTKEEIAHLAEQPVAPLAVGADASTATTVSAFSIAPGPVSRSRATSIQDDPAAAAAAVAAALAEIQQPEIASSLAPESLHLRGPSNSSAASATSSGTGSSGSGGNVQGATSASSTRNGIRSAAFGKAALRQIGSHVATVRSRIIAIADRLDTDILRKADRVDAEVEAESEDIDVVLDSYAHALDSITWVSPAVLASLGALLTSPRWFSRGWMESAEKGQYAFSRIQLQDISRRNLFAQRRQDMLAATRAALHKIVEVLAVELGPWSGGAAFQTSPLQLSLVGDAGWRHQRMVVNFNPLDYTVAAYKPFVPKQKPTANSSTTSMLDNNGSGSSHARGGTGKGLGEIDQNGLDESLRSLHKLIGSAAINLHSTSAAADAADDDDNDTGTTTDGGKPNALAAPVPMGGSHVARPVPRSVSSIDSRVTTAGALVDSADMALMASAGSGEEKAEFQAPDALQQDLDFPTRGGSGSGVALSSAAGSAVSFTTGASMPFAPVRDEIVRTEVRCKMITIERIVEGTLKVSNVHLIFEPDLAAWEETEKQAKAASDSHSHAGDTKFVRTLPPPEPRRWSLAILVGILPRRYLLQPCALEFFFLDSSFSFFAFPRQKAKEVFEAVWAIRPPRLTTVKSLQAGKHLKASQVREKWVRREISNFDYLMWLNLFAGRSFNCLDQYPVFPHVIKDYHSSTLDLNDPTIFRDLSRPIGALSEHRLELFKERMDALGDGGEIPPFLYGSHYSSAGIVLFYLIRVEPFTSLALELQAGHFDCPDRLFFSVPECWNGVLHSMSDVKETIPEWYTLPEMFINGQRLPLGALQDSAGTIDHVILPPWAKSAQEFVWINKAALESEYVSQHLHEWIDLIFGCAQRGSTAVERDNVFYHLTYEGAVDLDAITDPLIRKATEAQITHFGQTPAQLFRKPHPSRLPLDQCPQPLFRFALPLSLCPITMEYGKIKSRRMGSGLPSAAVVAAAALGLASSVMTQPPAGAVPAGSVPSILRSPVVQKTSLALFTSNDEGDGGRRTMAPQTLTDRGLVVYTAAVHPASSLQSSMVATQAKAFQSYQSYMVGLANSAGIPSSAHSSAGIPAFQNAPMLCSRPLVFPSATSYTSRDQEISFLQALPSSGKLLSIYGDFSMSLHRWAPAMTLEGIPFEIKPEKPKPLIHFELSSSVSKSASVTGMPLWSRLVNEYREGVAPPNESLLFLGAPAAVSSASRFAILSPTDISGQRIGSAQNEQFLFTCGFVDGGLRWQSVSNKGRAEAWTPRNTHRIGGVTTVAADSVGGNLLLTGHSDGSAYLWAFCTNQQADVRASNELISTPRGLHGSAHHSVCMSLSSVPLVIGEATETILTRQAAFIGPRAPITAAAISSCLNLVCVGSLNGTVVLFDRRSGDRHRVISLPQRTPDESKIRPLIVQHIQALPTGHWVIHWLRQIYPVPATGSAVPYQFDTHYGGNGGKYAYESILGVYSINGEALNSAVVASCFTPPSVTGVPQEIGSYVTSMVVAGEGTALVLGLSNGEVQVRHSFSLECGGFCRLHLEPAELQTSVRFAMEQAHQDFIEAAVAASVNQTSSSGSVASAARFAFGNALARLKGKGAQDRNVDPLSVTLEAKVQAALAALPASLAHVNASPGHVAQRAAAVTSLTLVDEERQLLAGCADGRIVVITDPAAAQKTLASTLQQGLFSLV